MGLKQITTSITYRVPDWNYCNLTADPAKRCRFCVKDRSGYRCALYNMPLGTEETVYVTKTQDCRRATAGFKSVVKDVEERPNEPVIKPKQVMKATLDDFTKMRNKLMDQGYPLSLAEKFAREYVIGGK